MKRFHAHLGVEEIDASVAFYSKFFGHEPDVLKPDYAKWMLDDPRVNFAISLKDADKSGVTHLGIQVENEDELSDTYALMKEARGPMLEEGPTTCCYAQSEKSWIADPDGVVWEAFRTTGDASDRGHRVTLPEAEKNSSAKARCCTPTRP